MEAVANVTLKHQARCVVAHAGERSEHQWLAATTSLRDDNVLRIYGYDDDSGEITNKAGFKHVDEAWCVAPAVFDAGLVFTGHNSVGASPSHRATLWRMPGIVAADSSDDDDDDDEGGGAGGGGSGAGAGGGAGASSAELLDLEEVTTLAEHDSTVHTILWSPSARLSSADVMTMDSTTVRAWSLADGGRTNTAGRTITVGTGTVIRAGAWDPHHSDQFSVACDASIRGFDMRSDAPIRSIDGAHGQCVRTLSYNPNKPWFLASGGDDAMVKFWDLRNLGTPVKVLEAHSHWVWNVAFNPFHDQLVLSGGSDGEALLWRVSSVSSAPLLDVDDEDEKTAADALIGGVEGHEDSVYAVAWSACNAWAFASLSYTGRLTICSVPAAEKYKILL